MSSLGKQIRRMRQLRGLNQGELAARAGIAQHIVSRIENDKSGFTITTLQKLTRILQLEILLIPLEQLETVQTQVDPKNRSGTSAGEKRTPSTPHYTAQYPGTAFDDVFIPDPDEGDEDA